MGYNREHAIVVMFFDDEKKVFSAFFKEAKKRLIQDEPYKEMQKLLITPRDTMNHQYVCAILPDGSKEGWGTSNVFQELRDELASLAKQHDCYYFYIQFYDDDGDERILESSMGGY